MNDEDDSTRTDQQNSMPPDSEVDGTVFNDDDNDEEEEDECRVCRGPAEEGRPLLEPCKCSGSMGMVHQDCLTSWLELKRGDGRCEICKTKFRFDPQYAENTPDRLSAHEVILGLSSRFLARWLPLALRIVFSAFLWLGVAPYLTNCLYLCWIVKPASILTRRDTILSDTVSGAVMVATIIISFLSLMSFADFLRVLWQRPPEQQVEGEQNDVQVVGDGDDGNGNANNEVDADDSDTDKRVVEAMLKHQNEETVTSAHAIISGKVTANRDEVAYCDGKEERLVDENEQKSKVAQIDAHNQEVEKLRAQATQLRTLTNERTNRQQNTRLELEQTHDEVQRIESSQHGNEDSLRINVRPNDYIEEIGGDDDGDGDDDDDGMNDNVDDPREVDDDDVWMVDIEEVEEDIDDDEHDDDDGNNDNDENERRPLLGQPQAVAFDPLDPLVQDDQVDMEINVALDELLGLRGPMSTLIRNMMWLLAFNATYLGIFGFVPKAVGSVIYSSIFNTTLCDNVLKSIPYVSSIDRNEATIISMLTIMEEESTKRNTAFKLSDFAIVTLGCLSIASFVVMLRYGLFVIQKGGKIFGRNALIESQNHAEAPNVRGGRGEVGIDLDADNGPGIGESIATAMDATVAIIKVCVLLFMKMFLLPLSLGIWLDASTARLFGHDMASSLAFAGRDLFSFLFLHWVAGISFMLLVTVFLLQLREVTHPDILAKLIRPQEPQPDLLGNLMHETVLTHMKRMLLSLAIYAPLLTLHVTLPIMLLQAGGLENSLKFFHLNLYYLLTPQLQIPLELITFHLSMLALLERYKNTIGGLQHRWMRFACKTLGLTKYLLPRRIKEFKLVGTKAVFALSDKDKATEIAPFFTSLVTKKEDVYQFISNNIDEPSTSTTDEGEQRLNGERVLSIGVRSISLPTKTSPLLLPTKIGKYRLRIEESDNANPLDMKMSFFTEIQGEEIERPPEGWDDLGAGGAFVQGRWAWADERKSFVEESVAKRIPLRASSKVRRPIDLIVKVVILVLLSWVAIVSTGLGIISLPLLVGRSFYHLLRIPETYIHDPFAFCVGAGLFFPTLSLIIRIINTRKESLSQRGRQWIARIRCPPTGKVVTVLETILYWIVIAPLMLGISYDFVFVKSPAWFSRDEMFRVEFKTLAVSWLFGMVVLNTWSYLLYFNFFTRRFWTNIGNGILEPPLNEDDNLNANARNREEEAHADNKSKWQGKQGRVAKFFKILSTVVFDCDWDTVDKTILVDDFALPATREICSALVGSLLSYRLIWYILATLFASRQGGFTIPLKGFVEHGVFRKFLFRFCMTVHLLFQIGSRSHARINRWFKFAHEAARDQKYLIGENLMNYVKHTN